MKKQLFGFLATACILFAACTDDNENREPQPSLRINGGTTFLSLDAQPRSGKLTIDASESWSIEAPTATWYTLSQQRGDSGKQELEIEFEANTGAARSAVIRFQCSDKDYPFTISQSAVSSDFNSPEYAFYITFGTMPTLYAGLHLLAHDRPSWVFYERSKTFAAAEFPTYATLLVPDDPTANATEKEMQAVASAVKRKILEINEQDPTAVFGLYVDDLRGRLGYDWFVAQGIDSTRVKVTLLSDGTATYVNYNTYFGDPATAEQNWAEYATAVDALDWNHSGQYPQTRVPAEFDSYTWAYYLATRPNYRLVLQNAALLQSSEAFDAVHRNQMNLVDEKPYNLLAALPAAAKAQFYRMAKFDYADFAAKFDASSKPNLIIIGTNTADLGLKELQKSYVKQVVETYGEQYDIFFKPHPADTSSTNYPTEFAGLTLLPGQMPFEIFLWALLDKIDCIGGFPSTVFIAVPIQKVGFIFAPNAQSLIQPLNRLFADAADVAWIQ